MIGTKRLRSLASSWPQEGAAPSSPVRRHSKKITGRICSPQSRVRPRWSVSAPFRISDVHLLDDRERVVDLDAKIAHSAFWHGREEAAPLRSCRSCGRSELLWCGAGRGCRTGSHPNPPWQPRSRQALHIVVLRGFAPCRGVAEQEGTGLPLGEAKIFIDPLPCLLRDLEADRATSFLLPDGGAFNGVAVQCNIFDFETYHIAAAKLAVARIDPKAKAVFGAHWSVASDGKWSASKLLRSQTKFPLPPLTHRFHFLLVPSPYHLMPGQ